MLKQVLKHQFLGWYPIPASSSVEGKRYRKKQKICEMCDASLPHSTIEYPFQHFSTHHFWSSNTTKYSWSIHNTYCYIWSSCPRSWPFVSPSSGNGYWAWNDVRRPPAKTLGKKTRQIWEQHRLGAWSNQTDVFIYKSALKKPKI